MARRADQKAQPRTAKKYRPGQICQISAPRAGGEVVRPLVPAVRPGLPTAAGERGMMDSGKALAGRPRLDSSRPPSADQRRCSFEASLYVFSGAVVPGQIPQRPPKVPRPVPGFMRTASSQAWLRRLREPSVAPMRRQPIAPVSCIAPTGTPVLLMERLGGDHHG